MDDLDTIVLFFDVRQYLNDKGIPFYKEGRNVTSGWIELNCPFCRYISPDPSHHLGISSKNLCNCWRCGPHSIIDLIKEYEDCNFFEAKEIVKQYQTHVLVQEESKPKFTGTVQLPKEIDWTYKDQMLSYLRSRRFPDSIVEKYQLAPCGRHGDFRFKIIIPVIVNEELVTFTSRDYTGKSELKKKHLPGIDIKQFLYNVDNYTGGKLFIFEGPPAVWRVGDNSVATFGTIVTDNQILAIVNLNPSETLICFDMEPVAQKQAAQLQLRLSHYLNNVYNIELPITDPDMLTKEQVQELRDL